MITGRTCSWWLGLVAGVLLLLSAEGAVATEAPGDQRGEMPFVMLPESVIEHPTDRDYCRKVLGNVVMVWWLNEHGTFDETVAKLKKAVTDRPAGEAKCIYIARSDEFKRLQAAAPLVDRIILNPFVYTSDKGPGAESTVWPTLNHPFINYLRDVQQVCPEKRLMCIFPLMGEPVHFKKRPATFEEVEWMLYAAVGADFKGVLWRGDPDTFPWASRLRPVTAGLRKYAADLGMARPIRWVKDVGGNPVSSVCSESSLFVVLLNPKYLSSKSVEQQQALPLESQKTQGEVEISPPEGITIVSGETLTGIPRPLRCEGKSVYVAYTYEGGGQIVVLHIARNSGEKAPGGDAPATSGANVEVFAKHKKDALASMEPEFARIASSCRADAAMRGFMERLKTMDAVALMLADSFQAVKANEINDLFSGAVKMAGSLPSKPSALPVLSPEDILIEYQNVFAAAAPLPPAPDQELQLMKRYCDVSAAAATSFVADRGRAFAETDRKRAPDVLPLCLVIPFLHAPDTQWSVHEIESLPEWMRSAETLSAVEDFALRVRRPLTAYQTALYGRSQDKNRKEAAPGYPDYLLEAAGRLVSIREYHAGMHCLRIGIKQAESEGDSRSAVALRFKLADVLETMGQSPSSAEEMKTVLEKYPKSDDWGKAALLRLKYLYGAGQYAPIIDEAPKYQADKRCAGYLPQILYISWVANRRENHSEEADKLQKLFLKEFPDHPLAADMYFASAMSTLAAGDYKEARRLLDIVVTRFPDSGVAKQANEIRARIEKSVGSK